MKRPMMLSMFVVALAASATVASARTGLVPADIQAAQAKLNPAFSAKQQELQAERKARREERRLERQKRRQQRQLQGQ